MSMKSIPVPQSTLETPNDPDKQDDHLSTLKTLAEKLQLETNRLSHLDWRSQQETQRARGLEASVASNDGHLPTWTSVKWQKSSLRCAIRQEQSHSPQSLTGFGSTGEAMEWLRKELREMHVQDQQLAHQLMRLHSDLNKLKMEQMCRQHRKMLNDATFELEERDEMLELLCDGPVASGFSLSTPLKLMGITKMNINSRRFSLC